MMSTGEANRFGFSINRSRLIDYDTSDRKVREYITLREPSFRLCFACGGCTATCTAGSHTAFNLRRMNTLIRRGETEPLREEVTRCMLCGKCLLVCPRGVNTRNVVAVAAVAIRKLDRNEL
jgi:heterodisulfide reductase subunit B